MIIDALSVTELKAFLNKRNVSLVGVAEKYELVALAHSAQAVQDHVFAMFAHMDRALITHALESTRGNIELAIEALLAMNHDGSGSSAPKDRITESQLETIAKDLCERFKNAEVEAELKLKTALSGPSLALLPSAASENESRAATPPLEALPDCDVCGEPATDTCAGCLATHYCGRACQRKHWREHKAPCKALPVFLKGQAVSKLQDELAQQDTNSGVDQDTLVLPNDQAQLLMKQGKMTEAEEKKMTGDFKNCKRPKDEAEAERQVSHVVLGLSVVHGARVRCVHLMLRGAG
jgi:hypothetical protein